MGITYHDEVHAKHRESMRRYRRRIKYGGVIPKFVFDEKEFFKLVPKRERFKGQGYQIVFALMGLGYQSMFQLKRSYLKTSTRKAICDYLNVPHEQLFRRVN